MKFPVIPECFYRGSGLPKEELGFPLRSASGMTRYGEIVEDKKGDNWILFKNA
jgi:hypothetical protein